MALIIQKFGGTSVANIDRIKKIVPIIKAEIAKNNQVIVVVSAIIGIVFSCKYFSSKSVVIDSTKALL
ncbi:MAG: hypothetical protein O7C58_05230 [Rickettsia endosymbiont of Ixodes persulcatus]|nr:hypothetical protein [Rickettsia endosymbiont of Ixodes persulcatus]